MTAGRAAINEETGLTPKQEAFARAFLETGNAAEAYRRSYDVAENAKDSWIYVEACQLLDNPAITQMLNKLREEAEKLSIYTLSRALEEYEEARKLAMSEKQAGAAVSAVAGKSKLFGLEQASKLKVQGDPDNPIEFIKRTIVRPNDAQEDA